MLTNFAEFILRNLSLTDRPFIRSHSRKNQVQRKIANEIEISIYYVSIKSPTGPFKDFLTHNGAKVMLK